MIWIIGLSVLTGFLTVILGVPFAKKYLKSSGIVGRDQQKSGKPELPTSGGVIVFLGFLLSISVFLGFSAVFTDINLEVELVLAALSSGSIIAMIGLLDDLNTGNEKGQEPVMREGLKQLPKMLLVLPAAFPLIAVGAGSWVMILPFVGLIEWGLIYPLFLLPVGLLFVSNVINMLAGTNGLSTLLSLIISSSLGLFAYINGFLEASIIAFSLSAALAGFLKFNFYPASFLPGDSLTYLSGGVIFASIVIGDMEKFALFIFLLYIIEFFLKARSGFNAHSWGNLNQGKLEPMYDKNYSLTHVFMRKGFSERQITLAIAGLQTLICVLGLIFFV